MARRKRSKWKDPIALVPIIVSLVSAFASLTGVYITVNRDSAQDRFDCSIEKKAVADIYDKHPEADLALKPDDPLERACDINSFVRSLRPTNAALPQGTVVAPPSPSPPVGPTTPTSSP